MRSGRRMTGFRALHERVDERPRDMAEHRPDVLICQWRREFIGELKFDLAAGLAERAEAPFAVQVAKRTVLQRDPDRFRRPVDVVEGEVREHAALVDVYEHR